MAHDRVDLMLAQEVLKDVVQGMILLHTDIIFHCDVKPQSIVQCGSSWKLTDFQSSRKIGNATRNIDKYNWGCCHPEVVITLLNSEQMNTISGFHTDDVLFLGCIIYHLLFGSPLCNVDSQQINILLSVFIYHCFHFFAMFTILLLSFLGIF